MTTVNIIADGGIKKKILKEGQGSPPSAGSIVGVLYTGTLVDGSEFDSTDGGYPFTFELGKGEVIKGWDRGIATMKLNEKAVLTISPEYGYGSEDSEDIPANSTLIFEVELVSIQKAAIKATAVQANSDLARLEQIRKEREESAKLKEIEKKKKEDEKKASAAAAAEKPKAGGKPGSKQKQKK